MVAALKSAIVTVRECGFHSAVVICGSFGKLANMHKLLGVLAVEMSCTVSPTAALTAAAETNSQADFGAEPDAGGAPPAATRAKAAPAIMILR
jgi:hypothetical protein